MKLIICIAISAVFSFGGFSATMAQPTCDGWSFRERIVLKPKPDWTLPLKFGMDSKQVASAVKKSGHAEFIDGTIKFDDELLKLEVVPQYDEKGRLFRLRGLCHTTDTISALMMHQYLAENAAKLFGQLMLDELPHDGGVVMTKYYWCGKRRLYYHLSLNQTKEAVFVTFIFENDEHPE